MDLKNRHGNYILSSEVKEANASLVKQSIKYKESQGYETSFLTSFKKGAGSAAAGTAREGEASARRVGDTHCKMCTRCESMFT
eukprot:15141-Rhodomonas_salina.1